MITKSHGVGWQWHDLYTSSCPPGRYCHGCGNDRCAKLFGRMEISLCYLLFTATVTTAITHIHRCRRHHHRRSSLRSCHHHHLTRLAPPPSPSVPSQPKPSTASFVLHTALIAVTTATSSAAVYRHHRHHNCQRVLQRISQVHRDVSAQVNHEGIIIL